MHEGRKLKLKAPSPAMIVALVALVFAMSGTAVAATKLVSGDKLIKKTSLSGNRLKKDTLTGTQINESKLGKVPSATTADTATTATNATNATNATHATTADTANAVADGAVGTTKLGALPGARVRSSSSQTITNNTATPLTFNTVDTNVGGVYSAGQPTRLTAPVAGMYVITAGVEWGNGAGGSRSIYLRVNGTTVVGLVDGPPNSDGTLDQSVATAVHLAAGDYVQAVVWQTAAGARDSWYAPNNAPVFTMNWIAP